MQVFLDLIATFFIIAIGIKAFLSIFRWMDDDADHALGTVFMLTASEDGNAQIAGPAIPEGTEHVFIETLILTQLAAS